MQEVKKVNIYYLIDPRSPEVIRYVGKTIMPLHKRLNAHINKIKYRKCYCSNWIKSLLNSGVRPTIQLLEEVEEQNWVIKEQYYIQLMRDRGMPLTNLTLGGEGIHGWKHSEEFKLSRRKENRKTYQRKFRSKEERYEAHSEWLKVNGRAPSPTKEQLLYANKKSIERTSKKVWEINSAGEIVATFSSTQECAKQIGGHASNVARVCRGVSKQTKGRNFTYAI